MAASNLHSDPHTDEWHARIPSTLEGAERHSQFVRTMRVALPLAAVGLIALVVVYSIINKPKIHIATTFKSQDETAGFVSMTAPRFTGLDVDGRYYVITADEAIRPAGRVDRIDLSLVHAEVKENGVARLALNADKGTVDADAGHLTFGPAVWVDLQDGFTMETDHAFADLGNGIITGNTPVHGKSPFGTFSADRFEMTRADQSARLTGHVHLTINPAALRDAPENLRDLDGRRSAGDQQDEATPGPGLGSKPEPEPQPKPQKEQSQ